MFDCQARHLQRGRNFLSTRATSTAGNTSCAAIKRRTLLTWFDMRFCRMPCLERHRRPLRSFRHKRLWRRSWGHPLAKRATTPFHPYPAVKVRRNYGVLLPRAHQVVACIELTI